jgi:hypothetical protein
LEKKGKKGKKKNRGNAGLGEGDRALGLQVKNTNKKNRGNKNTKKKTVVMRAWARAMEPLG